MLVGRDVLSMLALVFFAYLALSGSVRSEKSAQEITVYSESQAVRGHNRYAENCASRHSVMLEGEPLFFSLEPPSRPRWADEKHSVDNLFYIVRTLMPYGKPATLSKQEYIDIIAYLLMMNGHPAGAQALPLDPSVLGHNNKA
jgi:cytochrome c